MDLSTLAIILPESLKDEHQINIPYSFINVAYMKAWKFSRGLEVEREKITILTLFKHTFTEQIPLGTYILKRRETS